MRQRANRFTASQGYLLGDDGVYHFHRGDPGVSPPLWQPMHAHANVKSGTTKIDGAAVDGTVTGLPPEQFVLVTLVTAGDVEASRLSGDRGIGRSWYGDIAEILIYDRALSADEEQRIGSYLEAKWRLDTAYPDSGGGALGVDNGAANCRVLST